MYGDTLARLADRLTGLDVSKTVVRFDPTQAIPIDVVTDIVTFGAGEIRNTTRRPLGEIAFDDPLSASVESFIRSVRGQDETVVRPEEARLALETALMIEQAARAPAYRPMIEKIAATA